MATVVCPSLLCPHFSYSHPSALLIGSPWDAAEKTGYLPVEEMCISALLNPASIMRVVPGPASWRRDHGEGDRAILTEAILDQLATMSWTRKTAKTRKAPAEPKLQSDTTMGCRADSV